MPQENTIYQSLQARLVNGEFVPGQRLRAEALGQNYACSASAMREILFRLSTVGLVNFQEQRGFRLPDISPKLQHELTLFRILLESEGACLSIRNGGVAWESRLTAAHHKLSHIESKVGKGSVSNELLALWTNAELEFHQTLIDACASEVLKSTHQTIYQRFRQQLINSDKEFVFIPENIQQHQGILEAALAHDETLVRFRISEHLSRNLIETVPD